MTFQKMVNGIERGIGLAPGEQQIRTVRPHHVAVEAKGILGEIQPF
jgi:hypothetical protein